jgi:hypothetical protein
LKVIISANPESEKEGKLLIRKALELTKIFGSIIEKAFKLTPLLD